MASFGFENVSDTALWVAVHRARESERPDARFRDPYARLLAGERGEEIVRKTRYAMSIAWSTIVRTIVIDEFVQRMILENGIEMVVNLAAGLDTRPYRLQLPSALKWTEVDLPGITDYKEKMLEKEKPVCRLERIRLDLSDEPARAVVLQNIAGQAGKILVISEGLLVYLKREQVASLATALAQHPHFHWWLIDLASPIVLKFVQRRFGKDMARGGFQMQFAPPESSDFFLPFGWSLVEFKSMMEESVRLDRQMPMAWLAKLLSRFYPKEQREQFRKTGVVLLRRAT